MADIEIPALRGFDSYEVKLGDELRGHRASLGKSLLDVQRDLRIRASYIDAIENCDPSVIPNRGFVAGYVRAYARYLLLDPEEIYARFCAESGFVGASPAARPAAPRPAAAAARAPRAEPPVQKVAQARGAKKPAQGGGLAARLRDGVAGLGAARRPGPAYDPALARNHFSAPLGSARRVGLGVSLSGVASVAVLACLVGGLGWGGWLLIEDIQRVGFAPSPEAPDAIETPPNISIPGLSLQALADTKVGRDDERDAALAALYAPRDLSAPDIALRDGPIAAIDPDVSGLYADLAPTERGPRPGPTLARAIAGGAVPGQPAQAQAAPGEGGATGEVVAMAALTDPDLQRGDAPAPAAAPEADRPAGVRIIVTEAAWLRVKARDGSTLVQRIFRPGERYDLPVDATGAQMRAGNAGGVYLQVGAEVHGPLGKPGGVAKRVSLDPQDVRASYALATQSDLARAGADLEPAPRTEAQLTLD